jgi:hypothetical protein
LQGEDRLQKESEMIKTRRRRRRRRTREVCDVQSKKRERERG